MNADLNFEGVRIPFYNLSDKEAEQVRAAPGGGNMSQAQLDVWYGAIHPGETIIDFGANVGIISACLAMIGCVVHSVEGSPNNFKRLEKNLNPFGSVTIHPVAVSDVSKCVNTEFNDCLDHQFQPIRYVCWDEYSDLKPVFVKMDIEGMESVALHGMTQLIHEVCPIWQIEYHENIPLKWDGYPGFVNTDDGGFDFNTFKKAGYSIFDESMNEVECPSGHGIFFFFPK